MGDPEAEKPSIWIHGGDDDEFQEYYRDLIATDCVLNTLINEHFHVVELVGNSFGEKYRQRINWVAEGPQVAVFQLDGTATHKMGHARSKWFRISERMVNKRLTAEEFVTWLCRAGGVAVPQNLAQ